MTVKNFAIALFCALGLSAVCLAQAPDSTASHPRLTVGGYGEAAFTHGFYSNNPYRYMYPDRFASGKGFSQVDLPHVVVMLGYDFGSGWTMGTEIEFEHTGTGSSIELETDEGGEYEHEIEKGGEVELEQFWIQKSFSRAANIRVGHIVVPVGLNNAHHEPLNFFTVYRPEGENTILPSTWHDTGISFWGRSGDFRYEAQIVAGLNALLFTRDGWAHGACGSAYEFKPANKYGFAVRLDNYTIPGLRMALSGYYGQAMHNTYPNDMEGDGKTYDNVKANVLIGSFDFTYNRHNWIVRGQADYGYLSDTPQLNSAKTNSPKTSPYNKQAVGKNATAIGIEAGYDIFSQLPKLRQKEQKMYVFGRYEYYDSYVKEATQSSAANDYTKRNRIAFGINYYPIKQIAIKGEYSERFFHSPINNEPSINIGIAYEGFFL